MTTPGAVPRLGFRALRPRRGPALVWLPALAVAAAMAIPVVYLIVRAAEADSDAWSNLGHSSTLTLLKNTVVLAFAVTGAAAALALPIAWLTVRTNLPLRRMWSVISVLPLVIPSFVGALAFIAALGPRGSFQRLLEPLGVDSLPTIYGFPGTWLALTLFTFPLPFAAITGGPARHRPGAGRSVTSVGRKLVAHVLARDRTATARAHGGGRAAGRALCRQRLRGCFFVAVRHLHACDLRSISEQL